MAGPAPERRSRLSRAAAALGVLVLLMSAAVVVYSVQREEALRREISASYEARASVTGLFTLLQDAETGQRGFLLTGDRAFLQPYLAAKDRVEAERRHAASHLPDPRAAAGMERLRPLIARKLSEMARTLSLAAEGRRGDALALIRSGEGRRHMEAIREIVTGVVAAEDARLEARRAARMRVRTVLMVSVVGLTILLLGLIALGLRRENRLRRDRAGMAQALEDRAARLSAILESASDGIVTLNPSGSIETINPAGARMFGYAAEELLRRDVSILADVARRGFGAFHERLASGDATLGDGVVREVTARRKDGSTFPVDVAMRGMPLPDGMHIVAVVRDVSERRRAEALKEEFVSTVSHELRTPLTSIAGALGLLRTGAAGVLPERAARLVDIADANSTRLVRLINNILDIEKLEAGEVRLQLQPTPMNDLAVRAVDAMSGLGEEKGVPFLVEPSPLDPVVAVDPDRILQVLTNLLSNAIKVSAADRPVTLRVTAGRESARLAVVDRGPGVPERFRPRLFQKFAQADGSDAKAHGGTGLGLAIAREIAERHGGRLEHAPAEEGGAAFTLELPLAAAAPPAPRPPSARSRLLVCEDDPLTADHLRDELTRLGHRIDVVGGANEARLALHSGDYAALLLDVGLPDVDGLTLVRALRAAPATRDLPVIIISGTVDHRQDGRLLDLVDWIDKPVDLERLRGALDNALRRAPGTAPVILHVDDDRDLLEVTRAALGGAGRVVAAESLEAAREVLRACRPSVVILDLGLPDGSGVELIPDLAELGEPPVPVIVYTAQEPGSDVEAMAADVFTKSRVGLQRLADAVSRLAGPAGGGS